MSYANWIKSAGDRVTTTHANDECLHVIRDYLYKVVGRDQKFQKMRDYFSFLDKELGEYQANARDVLRTFRSFKRHTLKDVEIEHRMGQVRFPGTPFTTVTITEREWKRDRVKALDQYVRYLCGISSEFAVRADYIRMVYSPLISEARSAKRPFAIRVPKDLVCLDNSITSVEIILNNDKSWEILGIKGLSHDGKNYVFLVN